ncbi:prefoldin subunit [Candidatus Woesearchaeota archaeon]|nr:prefoldin subunit [Candidatus Woesearchaeota archaeon]
MEDQNQQIQKLQQLEQNLQSLMVQRQTFQSQSLDTENALKEMQSPQKEVYKIMGTIMVNVSQEKIKKELEEEKEILSIRIKNIEKQEDVLKKESEKIKKEVLEKLKQ